MLRFVYWHIASFKFFSGEPREQVQPLKIIAAYPAKFHVFKLYKGGGLRKKFKKTFKKKNTSFSNFKTVKTLNVSHKHEIKWSSQMTAGGRQALGNRDRGRKL